MYVATGTFSSLPTFPLTRRRHDDDRHDHSPGRRVTSTSTPTPSLTPSDLAMSAISLGSSIAMSADNTDVVSVSPASSSAATSGSAAEDSSSSQSPTASPVWSRASPASAAEAAAVKESGVNKRKSQAAALKNVVNTITASATVRAPRERTGCSKKRRVAGSTDAAAKAHAPAASKAAQDRGGRDRCNKKSKAEAKQALQKLAAELANLDESFALFEEDY